MNNRMKTGVDLGDENAGWSTLALICIVVGALMLRPLILGVDTNAAQYRLDSNARIIMTIEQEDIRPMQETEYRFTLVDAQDQPIEASGLTVNLTMPKMLCGVIPTSVSDTGIGTYSAVGIPIMEGSWVAEASFQIAAHTYRAVFPFQVH